MLLAPRRELFQVVFEEVKRELSGWLTAVLPDPNPWAGKIAGIRTYIETHTDPSEQRIVLLDARSVLSHEACLRVDSQWGAVMFRGGFRRAMNRGPATGHATRTRTHGL